MIEDNYKLKTYLNCLVNSVFKILPLYEEKNVGVEIYVDSLLFELYGLKEAIKIDCSYEYVSLLSTLESVKIEMSLENPKKSVIKREIFKSINIIKNMVGKLGESD